MTDELRGWPVTTYHRIVHHFDDSTTAETEAEARQSFEKDHGPHTSRNQWLHLWRGAEIKPTKGKARNVKRP